ncbi:hypothetical protein [Micromonospora sp. URMC 106]|uniref:hypothetical protein n=1 Tax=Micromonospora sp. URMC 106 TaxID=3423408 RepID=UPI003F52C417
MDRLGSRHLDIGTPRSVVLDATGPGAVVLIAAVATTALRVVGRGPFGEPRPDEAHGTMRDAPTSRMRVARPPGAARCPRHRRPGKP